MTRATLHPRQNRRLASMLAVLMLLGTVFPTGFASAQQLIAKPGAGVSRLPLNVTAFQADGFGDLSDALNLATGNVYLNIGGVSMNNLMGSGDDTSQAVGVDGWSLNARLRLQGFHKGLSSAPGSLLLGEGDGGGTPFERYTVSRYSNVPSWIERYKDVPNATIYRNPEQDGVQYLEEFVVLLVRSNDSIAHYYDHGGTRYTFHDDGEFLDYAQDLHQQYRSAQAGFSEGREVKGEATILTYRNTSKGQLSKVQDPWGRVTIYIWNSNGTLRYIDELLQNESNANSYVSRISFFYTTYNNQRVLDKVFIARTNGLKHVTPSDHNMADVDRRYRRFYYTTGANGQILLNRFVKEGFNGNDSRSQTFYRYDSLNRVTRVHTTDKSGTRTATFTYYTYGSSSDFGGQKVTVKQGIKESVYEFDALSQLRRKRVKDFNPRYNETKWLTWNYTYGDADPSSYCYSCNEGEEFPRGSAYRIEEPSGKVTTYSYDDHGNLMRVVESAKNSTASNLEREQIFHYDRDNRLVQELTPMRGDSVGDASWNYTEVHRWRYHRNFPTVYANSQSFTALKQTEHDTWTDALPGDATVTDTFDLYGRLTETKRVGADQTHLTTYEYHEGMTTAFGAQYFPDANGIRSSNRWTPYQYSDQVHIVRATGKSDHYFMYDPYGNVIVEKQFSAFGEKFEGDTAVGRIRRAYRSYNGFGQPVWELVMKNTDSTVLDNLVERRMWFYHATTGDLKHSWEGNRKNVTTYTYTVGGTDNGRVSKIEQGVSNSGDGTLSTVRGQTLFAYDEFGRVKQKTLDKHADGTGFTFDYRRDTLDRVVEAWRPAEHGTAARGSTGYKYDATGQVSYTWSHFTALQHFLERDAFGRVTEENWDNRKSVHTTYDPYDRPIAVRDERLQMNKPGEDRTRYYRYDALGNLTHELGVPMRTYPDGNYVDERRPYAIHHYDALGRKVKEQRLINGSTVVRADNLIALNDIDSNVAVTKYRYNEAGRLTAVIDPENYYTSNIYDNSGNVIKQVRQVCRNGDTDCLNSVEGLANISGVDNAVITHMGYDAIGRQVWHRDARGHERSTTYDLLGNVTKQVNERDQEIRYYYTEDGLLRSVYEPALNGSSGEFFRTKYYSYDNKRRYPSQLNEAQHNVEASYYTGSKTLYEYDWRGNVVKTILPATEDETGASVAAFITQTYNMNGNLLSVVDAEGFETAYAYDKFGRVKSEHKKERADSIDSVAFPHSNGLLTEYWYDAAGNLIREERNGLNTFYNYNSLGKVIAESRASTSDTPDPNKKLKTYRLDGVLTAETTYDYRGDLGANVANIAAGTRGPFLPVTRGNITGHSLDKRGYVTATYSHGSFTRDEAYTQTIYLDHDLEQQVNGLGLRYKRNFKGTSDVYTPIRVVNSATGAETKHYTYDTYWKYDQNGNKKEKWDQVTGDVTKHNWFRFTYTETNKEYTRQQDVYLRQSAIDPNAAHENARSGILMAGTDGYVRTHYNARDQISETNATDHRPVSVNNIGGYARTKTTYNYYNDGRKRRVDVDTFNNENEGYTLFEYDARGREIKVTDGKAEYVNQDFVVENVTTYHADGTRITKAISALNSQDGSQRVLTADGMCRRSKTVPTVGGLIYESYSGCENSDAHRSSVYTYGANGKPKTMVGHGFRKSETGNTQEEEYSYTYSYYTSGLLAVEEVVYDNEWEVYNPLGFTVADNYYNDNGDLVAVKSRPIGGHRAGTARIAYMLNSRGNRLKVEGEDHHNNRYHGWKKRYHPEGQAAEFYAPGRYVQGQERRYVVVFAYDPFGNQVISSKISHWQHDGGSYQIERDAFTNLHSGSNVEMIRANTGYVNQYSTSCSCGWEDPENERVKNETFTFFDGFESKAWDIPEPFNVSEDAALPLEAPEEAVSERLGVLPADVVAPEDASPNIGDITDVQAPQEGSEEVSLPAEESSSSTNTLSTTTGLSSLGTLRAVGTTDKGEARQSETTSGQGLGELQALPAVGNAPASTPQTRADRPFDLDNPESALPAGLAEVQASDVVAPSSTISSLPETGNVTEVKAPGMSTPPSLGTSPSDGPLEVAPPASVQGPSVPEIGDGTPDAIGEVAPPIGWGLEDSQNEVLSFSSTDGGCGWMLDRGFRECVNRKNAARLQEEQDNIKKDIDNALGDEENEDVKRVLYGLVDQLKHVEGGFEQLRVKRVIKGIAQLSKTSPNEGLLYGHIVGEMINDGAFDTRNLEIGNVINTFLSHEPDELTDDSIRTGLNTLITLHAVGDSAQHTRSFLQALDYMYLGSSLAIGLAPGSGFAEGATGQSCAVGSDGPVCEGIPNWMRWVSGITDVGIGKLADIPYTAASGTFFTLRRALKSDILFGQKRIANTFRLTSEAPDFIRGRTIGDVAADLRAGIISPDDIPIRYFEYNGQRITINNRGLAALSDAGISPTNLIEVPLDDVSARVLGRLGETPVIRGQTLPGVSIPITTNKDGSGLLRVITLPEF